MKVVAVSMFHNEADVAPYVVHHMLEEVDRVIVADNRSTDGTRDLLDVMATEWGRLTVVDEPRFGYGQAATMNRLATMADADWVVPFDADEWWYAVDGRPIGDVLEGLPGDSTSARMCDLIPQPDDPDDPNPFTRITRTRPGTLWARHTKLAYRPGPGRVLAQGNHGLEGIDPPPPGPLAIRHIPFRSYEQAKAKLRHGREAIQAAGLPVWSGVHWQEWGAYSDARLEAWWAEWTDPEGLRPWAP